MARVARRAPDAYQELMRFMLLASVSSVGLWMVVRQLGPKGLGRWLTVFLFLGLAGLAFWSALSRRRLTCCYALAYLTAVEPAIRGYGKSLPYLSLEYLILLIGVITLLQRRAPLRLPTLLLGLYFLMEVVGALAAANQEDARWMTIMTGARLGLFLIIQRTELKPEETVRVVGCYVAGTLAIAAMSLSGALQADTTWSTQSNYRAAGGFGPNQVAGLLALGAFGGIFLADVDPRPWARLAYLGSAGVMVLSALFTFTRGGSVILVLGILFYVTVLALSRRISGAVLGAAIVLPVAALFAISYTDQMLLARYGDTEMSGRESIWSLGLRIFWDNPVFGVGTGNFYEASEGRLAAYHGRVGSHNELIRALSEHGLVGASLWLGFVFACIAACWQESRGLARAAGVSWVLMAVAFECHSGLKLAMSAFFMALAVEGFRMRAVPAPAPVSVRKSRLPLRRLQPGPRPV